MKKENINKYYSQAQALDEAGVCEREYLHDSRVMAALERQRGWSGYLVDQMQLVKVRITSDQLEVDALDIIATLSFPALAIVVLRWYKWRHHTRYRSIRVLLCSCLIGPISFLLVRPQSCEKCC